MGRVPLPAAGKIKRTEWGIPLTEAVNEHDEILLHRILGRGRRITNSSTTTTEVGVLRIDDIPVAANHVIRVYTNAFGLHSTVANDIVRATFRYTTDGSTPTTASTRLNAGQINIANTSFPPVVSIAGIYVPTVDETLSVLLAVSRMSGSGNASILASSPGFEVDMVIEDTGVDPGDTGVDV